MTTYARLLSYRLPMFRGLDVKAVQRRLSELGHSPGSVDGAYGPATARAVRDFQTARSVTPVDGIVGRITWGALFGGTVARAADPTAAADATDALAAELAELKKRHSRFPGGVEWRLAREGLIIDDGAPARTSGEPKTVRRIWREYGAQITKSSDEFFVPAELIVATICTESGGDASARREEPGFTSDAATPHRVSTGLMQTLISTASETLGKPDVTSRWLAVPANSLRAGTAYIARQRPQTDFDPPVVACAYNAGGVYHQTGRKNHWRMRQYPIGTGKHADRFVQWFGDCLAVFAELETAGAGEVPAISFHKLLR